ncbi:DUF4136 domain-containing protein [Autumnicola edwardsiae]|uniref:DUF4136 domain-containing protein n=1 Tax=Autumnicola edwardsiae TaxID=3075594 RepID=A0ABU3CTX6_9FLAO|nr:DUF4136 domain-containing protein [Zunongwangia sp. F297]MDT0649815.1 DUF4136 domain-containing protein [Zunongwangia sp. F297]
MKAMKSILFCSILIMVLSCGPRVQTVKPMDTDLSKYSTFAYLPNTNVEVPGKGYNDENVNRMIVETVNQNMEQTGYTLDRDNPDLLVLISTSTEIERETTTDPVYATYPYTAGVGAVSPYYGSYYYRGYNTFGGGIMGYDTDTYAYEEGIVVINLVDRQTKETVWKGITSDALYDQRNTVAMRDLVNEIFDEYPLNNN